MCVCWGGVGCDPLCVYVCVRVCVCVRACVHVCVNGSHVCLCVPVRIRGQACVCGVVWCACMLGFPCQQVCVYVYVSLCVKVKEPQTLLCDTTTKQRVTSHCTLPSQLFAVLRACVRACVRVCGVCMSVSMCLSVCACKRALCVCVSGYLSTHV